MKGDRPFSRTDVYDAVNETKMLSSRMLQGPKSRHMSCVLWEESIAMRAKRQQGLIVHIMENAILLCQATFSGWDPGATGDLVGTRSLQVTRAPMANWPVQDSGRTRSPTASV